jgi:hypothetical protein
MIRRNISAALMVCVFMLISGLSCERWVDEREDTLVLENVLGRLVDTFESGDIDRLGDMFLKDEMLTVIEPYGNEPVAGWDQFEILLTRVLDRFRDREIIQKKRILVPGLDERTAYFMEYLDASGMLDGDRLELKDMRLSGVLERHAGRWNIVLLHISQASEHNFGKETQN